MSLQEKFDAAAEQVKTLANTPSNDELLQLYGLFKQATVGDCNTSKPGMFDLKGKKKWESWDGLKGTSTADAQQRYVDLVASLAAKQ